MSALSISQLKVATKEDFMRLLPAISSHVERQPDGRFEIRGSAEQVGLTEDALTELRRAMAEVNAMLDEPLGRHLLAVAASGRLRQVSGPAEAEALSAAAARASAAGDSLPLEQAHSFEIPVPLAFVLAALFGAIVVIGVHLAMIVAVLTLAALIAPHCGLFFVGILVLCVLVLICIVAAHACALLIRLAATAASKGEPSIRLDARVILSSAELVLVSLAEGRDQCAASGGAGFAC